MIKTALVMAAVLSSVTTCSSPTGDAAEDTSTSSAEAAATTAPASPTSPRPSPRAEMGAEDLELLYVNPSAPGCTTVWQPGATLPRQYEWCRGDDGDPVAGVRMGSCEVIVFRNELYAIPGRRIQAVQGEITSDPRYLRALTHCPVTKPRPGGTS